MPEQEEENEIEQEKGYEKALRVNLDKEISDEFEFIKKYKGFVMDSDLIRILVREEKRRVDKQKRIEEKEEIKLKILKAKLKETETE